MVHHGNNLAILHHCVYTVSVVRICFRSEWPLMQVSRFNAITSVGVLGFGIPMSQEMPHLHLHIVFNGDCGPADDRRFENLSYVALKSRLQTEYLLVFIKASRYKYSPEINCCATVPPKITVCFIITPSLNLQLTYRSLI